MKSMRIWSIIIMAAIMLSMVSACGGDDNDGGNSGGNSLIGWYCYFERIDPSDMVNEELTVDEHFDGGGMYRPHKDDYYDPEQGTVILGWYTYYEGRINAIHIIDDHNLVKYHSYGPFKTDHEEVRKDYGNKLILYQFIAGRLGKLTFYDAYNSETYYTYTHQGNTISVYLGKDDDGKDDYLKLNILPDGLVESGAPKWVKYDPNTVYDYSNTSGNSSSEPTGNSSSGNNGSGDNGSGGDTEPAQCNTLSELKSAIDAGKDCSSYATGSYYVDASGNISTSTTDAIGRIAYVSTSDVEIKKPGSRILVLALTNVGDYWWKNEDTGGESAYNDDQVMNGLEFTSSHARSSQRAIYPAAYYTYHWETPRPSATTPWFIPSSAQGKKMLKVAKASGEGQITKGRYWYATENIANSDCANGYDYTYNKEISWKKSLLLRVRACFAY